MFVPLNTIKIKLTAKVWEMWACLRIEKIKCISIIVFI